MTAYLDTSALVAIVLREPRHDLVRTWLEINGEVLVVSDFTLGEFASALGLKVRSRQLSEAAARDYITAARRFLVDRDMALVSRTDIERATQYVLRFDLALRLPDAIHIAIAHRLDTTLVSLDKRQLDGARALSVQAADPFA